jgi:hypothetical protein
MFQKYKNRKRYKKPPTPPELKYSYKPVKKGNDMYFEVYEKNERETQVIAKYFFEEDAKRITDFHNKKQVWRMNEGIPKWLTLSDKIY